MSTNAMTEDRSQHDQRVRHSGCVSWWLEPIGEGWRYVMAGSNWIRRSGVFPTQYAAQAAALAIFAEAV